MPSFVVDPVLCTTPEGDEPEEASRWLAALGAWLDAVEASPFEWRHVHRCSLALLDMGRFPAFDSLRRAQKIARADVNTGGLLRRISRFFQNEEHDLLAVTATRCFVVPDGQQPMIAPADVLGRNLPEVSGLLTDALLCVACDKATGERFARTAHFVTLPFAGGEREILVAGPVGLVDPDTMSERLGDKALNERFPVLLSPDDLSDFDRDALLAGGEAGLAPLIDSMAGRSFPGATTTSIGVGAHFWQSMEKTGILQDAFASCKLLRICAGLVADRLEEMNVDRRFKRSTMAPDSPQQTRKSDEGRAWRLTITKHGAGYRLHYWHVPASGGRPAYVELANVLRETDPVTIPES